MAGNHELPFRPVRAGTQIYNPDARNPAGHDSTGTLGAFVRDATGTVYVLSNYHVMCGTDGQCHPGEPIYQHDSLGPEYVVAQLARWVGYLDAAIAALRAGVEWLPEQLGIGRIAAVASPIVDMPVIKAGASTGVTEGVVVAVSGTEVRIGLPPGFDSHYELTEVGDSGSLWLERDSHRAIALHTRGELPGASEIALAVDLNLVLNALGVTLVL